jgi:hypothetical protein
MLVPNGGVTGGDGASISGRPHVLPDGDAGAFHVPKPRCLLLMVTGNRRAIVFDAGTGAYKRHWGGHSNKPDGSNWLKCRQMSHPRRQAKKSNNRCESNVSYWPDSAVSGIHRVRKLSGDKLPSPPMEHHGRTDATCRGQRRRDGRTASSTFAGPLAAAVGPIPRRYFPADAADRPCRNAQHRRPARAARSGRRLL